MSHTRRRHGHSKQPAFKAMCNLEEPSLNIIHVKLPKCPFWPLQTACRLQMGSIGPLRKGDQKLGNICETDKDRKRSSEFTQGPEDACPSVRGKKKQRGVWRTNRPTLNIAQMLCHWGNPGFTWDKAEEGCISKTRFLMVDASCAEQGI